jgi:ubiquinone/menaquinone biosynthesis C-methylase UbiE
MGWDTGRVSGESDRWSQWLLERRDAGDAGQRAVTLDRLAKVRDRVLDNAEPLGGATLLDIGAGDGLIGLAALQRVGPDGRVIFSDISRPLLDSSRVAVEAQGALDIARFVLAGAEDLAGILDGSVDVVTSRSVLIYVTDKPTAFAELYRVLAPGGRISLYEPINCLMFPEPEGRFWGYDLRAVCELVAKVDVKFTELEGSEYDDAMMGFDDRDLARMAEDAGFERIHVECHLDIERAGLARL